MQSRRILGGGRLGSLHNIGKAGGSPLNDTIPFIDELQAKHLAQDHSEIIFPMELLNSVAFACAEALRWKGAMVFYVTHNANVQEVEHGFSCTSAYIHLHLSERGSTGQAERIPP